VRGVLDLNVEVPTCDCLATFKAPEPKPEEPVRLHRPGCPRMKAIRRKWGVE
jgi:hypothetical protein